MSSTAFFLWSLPSKSCQSFELHGEPGTRDKDSDKQFKVKISHQPTSFSPLFLTQIPLVTAQNKFYANITPLKYSNFQQFKIELIYWITALGKTKTYHEVFREKSLKWILKDKTMDDK